MMQYFRLGQALKFCRYEFGSLLWPRINIYSRFHRVAALRGCSDMHWKISLKSRGFCTKSVDDMIPTSNATHVAKAVPPKTTKPKEPKKVPKSRLPYKSFKSCDGIEIRVGRTAADNDELSTNRKYRDDNDWWLHIASHPGTHIVVKYSQDDLPQAYPNTVTEAALLAVANSKVYSPNAGRVPVTLTRCAAVHKVPDTPDGQVRLHPSRLVQTVTIDVKRENYRLEALNKTKS